MPRWTDRPLVAVPVLLAVAALVVLPNLGASSLWDDDEGVNAGCTREMIESDTWVVPTFNWDLRTAKPILLYWLMRPSFAAFGETEFAARLPSAAAFIAMVLAVYGLGRGMFGGGTGFVAGLIAASSMGLVYLGRAATTDSLLILFTTVYFWAFWWGSRNGRRGWFIPCGVASGLMMLTKGPAVGLVLPAAVVGVYLLWTRQLRQLIDPRMPLGVLAWVLVAVPWYVFVATETKGDWPMAFFFKENVGRASEPMEGHKGVPVVYEVAVVCVLFAPWSGFLGMSVWGAFRSREPQASASERVADSRRESDGGGGVNDRRAGMGPPSLPHGRPNPIGPTPTLGESRPPEQIACGSQLLLCWLAVYFVACSAAATKLPHYIAPAYPALALLTARLLTRWAANELTLPKWVIPTGLVGFAVTGLSVVVGLLVGGGVIPLSGPQVRTFPGLGAWAWVGVFPLLSAAAGWWFWRKGNRPAVVGVPAAGTVLFVAVLSAFAPQAVDEKKAVKELVRESGARVHDREARVASLDYTQPSVTFYTARRVERLQSADAAAEFLAFDIESYLFVPEPLWEEKLAGRVSGVRVAARRYDFYRNCFVLVVTNRDL
jgi:4-amino-4-deoxy-L-arabinose transferase-like glycosyltransferase